MYHLSRRSNLAIALIFMKKEQLSNLHPFTSIHIHLHPSNSNFIFIIIIIIIIFPSSLPLIVFPSKCSPAKKKFSSHRLSPLFIIFSQIFSPKKNLDSKKISLQKISVKIIQSGLFIIYFFPSKSFSSSTFSPCSS